MSEAPSSSNIFNDDPDVEEDQDSAEKVFLRLKNGLFGVLYIMSKDAVQASVVAGLGIFIDFVQMVGFAFQKNCGFAWNLPTTAWITTVTSPVKAIGLDVNSSSSWRAVFYLSLMLVGLLLADAAFVFWQFSQNRFHHMWTLRLLRMFSSALVGPLFIPIIQVFLQQIPCLSFSCGSAELTIVAWIALFVGVFYIFLCLILTLTYYPRNPMGGHPLARSSGRLTMLQLLLKLILVVTFNLIGPLNQPWILIIIYTVGNTLLCFVYTWQLPFYLFAFNEFRCVAYWVQVWVGVCLVISQLMNSPDDRGVSVLLFITTPLVMVLSDLVVRARRTHVSATNIFDVSSPEDVELKVRFLLQDFMNFKMQKNIWSGNLTARAGSETASEHSEGRSMQGSIPRWSEFDEPEYENEEDFIPLIRRAEKWYELGCKRFPTATMLLLRAQFYLFYYPENKVIGMNSLTKAEDRDPSLDESFSVYYFRRLHEESFSTDGSNRDIIAFIEINKYLLDAKKWDQSATRLQSQFWGTLLEPDPDTIKLSLLAGKINTSTANAAEAYRHLVKLHSVPPPEVLRAYASFLIDVACDEARGLQLLKRADETEDSKSQQTSSNSQLSGKSASISISGDMHDLGTIMTINSATTQVFGYSRHEMQGKNINMIMPEPYAKFHNRFLSRYLESAKATLLNAARDMFALHKNGYLFSVQLNIRQIASSKGCSFLGLVQKLDMTDEIVFLNPAFCITASTRGWAVAHNLTPEVLVAGQLSISRFIPSFHENIMSMSTDEGFRVSFPRNITYWLTSLVVENESWRILRIRDENVEAPALALPAPSPKPHSRVKFSSVVAVDLDEDEEETLTPAPVPQAQNDTDEIDVNADEIVVDTEPAARPSSAFKSALVLPQNNPIFSPKDSRTDVYSNTVASPITRVASFQVALSPQPTPTGIHRSDSNVSGKRASFVAAGSEIEIHPDDNAAVERCESETSGSSASTATSALSIRKTLRSFSRSRSVKGLGPTLHRLRSTLFICLLVVCATALTKYFIVNSLLTTYSTQLSDVNTAGSRRTYALNGGILALELLLVNMGLLPADHVAGDQSLLASSAAALNNIHQSLYVAQVDSLTADQRLQYSIPSVPITKLEVVGNSVLYTTELQSLSTCIQEVVSAASTLSVLPLNSIKLEDPNVFFLLQNAPSVILTSLNQSSNQYVDTIILGVDVMRKWTLALTAASIALLTVVIFFIVRPPVYDVESNKDDVLDLFLEVPAAVVQKFFYQSSRRLARLHNDDEFAEEKVANMDDFDEVGASDGAALGMRSNTMVDSRRRKKRESKKSRWCERFNFQRHVTMLKILGYLGAALVYFLVTYYIEFVNIQDSLLFSAHEVNYSGLRRTYVRLMDFGLMMLASQNLVFNSSVLSGFPSWSPPISPSSPMQGPFLLPNVSYAALLDGISEFQRIQDALLFGSSSLITDIPSNTPGMSNLLFSNACTASGTSDCTTFSKGLLARGLATALAKYIEVSRLQLDIIASSQTGKSWQYVPSFNFVNSSLNTDTMNWIRQIERAEVFPSLLDATTFYANKASWILSNIFPGRLAALVVYLSLTVLVYIFFYLPLMWFLNDETRRICSMLLMLPPEVLEKLPRVKLFMGRLASSIAYTDELD